MAATHDIEPRLVDALIAHAATAQALGELAGGAGDAAASELMAELDVQLADRLIALGVDQQMLSRAMATLAIELCRLPRRD